MVRKVDQQHGISPLVVSVSLQQFRQMIGLQSSATNMNDRRILSSQQRSVDTRRQTGYPPMNNGTLSSSSSSSGSSLPNMNLRLMNGYKSNENKKWPQDSLNNYSSMSNTERQHLTISPRRKKRKISSFTDTNRFISR